mgnify:CR=1 FL=1
MIMTAAFFYRFFPELIQSIKMCASFSEKLLKTLKSVVKK